MCLESCRVSCDAFRERNVRGWESQDAGFKKGTRAGSFCTFRLWGSCQDLELCACDKRGSLSFCLLREPALLPATLTPQSQALHWRDGIGLPHNPRR